MAQNSGISSRKQELLSRLKNTLAIVSQATGFDRLDEDRHLGDRRDVDQRQIDPRTVDRRQMEISAVDPITRSGDRCQMDTNPLDPRLYRSHVGSNTQTDEPIRWSGQRDSDIRQPVRSQQMQIDDDDDASIYRRMQFPSPAPPAKPCLKSSGNKPVVDSSFAKFGEIEDEDEFLYGKEDVTPKPSSTSRMVDDSQWLEARDVIYRSGSSQSSASLSSAYMRASNRSPLPHQFSNTQVDDDSTRMGNIGSQSQQPFVFSNSYHIAPDSIRTADANRMSPQLIRASPSSNSDSLSVLGNVNTDMLQNILKLVSLQKPAQSRHDHSQSVLGLSDWTQETHLPPQQSITPNVGSVVQRTCMQQTSAPDYHPAISELVSSSGVIQETAPGSSGYRINMHQKSDSPGDSWPSNLASTRNRDNNEPYKTTLVMSKEQDSESKPPAMLSDMKMSAMVSRAASDTGSRMSALVSAVESETSSSMSELLSVVADDTSHASKIEKAEADVKDEVFDRLVTMLGCNSNIKLIMQQLIKKERAGSGSEISKKKVADPQGTEQKMNQQFPTYTEVENIQKEQQMKQEVAVIKAELKEDYKLKSPTTSEKINFESDISEEEESKSSASIPVVSSLARLQNNYDSDSDYNPQTAAKGSDKFLGDKMKATDAEINQVSARDSEWEKNTAEFLRRLQTKKCVVTPREKSRSPRRMSRDRPRSPMKRSLDKSLSPRRRSEDRSQSPKQAAKKNPELDKCVPSQTAKKISVDCKDRSQSPRTTTKSMPSKLTERSESPKTSVETPKTVVTKYDDVQGKDASGKSKYSGENKKDVSDQKVSKPDKPSPVTLSDEDRSQLIKAKEELTSTVALLMSELEKLRVERSALALKADGRYRNEELRKNIALQEEMGEHICSLKKALNELDCQLDKANLALTTSAPVSKPEGAEQKPPDKSRKENTTRIVSKKDASRNLSRSSTSSTSSSRSSSSSSSSRSRSRSRSGKRSNRRRYHRRHSSRDRYKTRRNDSGKKGSNQAPSKRYAIVVRNNTKQSERKNTKQSDVKTLKPGEGKNVAPSSPASKPPTLEKKKPDLQDSARETANTAVGKLSTEVNIQVGSATPQSLGSTSSAGISSAVGNQSEEPLRAVGSGSADRGGASTFSRENLISSLQQMVRSTEDSTSSKEKNEPYTCVMKEKQTSALELAIAMYLAANEFYDGGNLWCRLCDGIFHDISALCRHIHSDQHQLKLDPNYNQPKHPSVMHKPSCSDGSFVAPARGDEFLMPIQSFFCSLCCEYSKDSTSAETHLKSQAHNAKFKGFLKDNPTYEMQFLRGKMLAAQNVMVTQKDITPQKKEEQSNSEQLDDSNVQAPDISKQKRKFEEAEADVKRVKIERKITNDVLKIERKVTVDVDKVTATQEVEKDTRKVILIKEDNDKADVESRSDSGKGTSVKKNPKVGPDKQEKTSWAERGRSPEKYRDRVESRSWDKRDTSERSKGHRDDRNDDRSWKSPQFTSRKESPHRTQENKKRVATSKSSEEKSSNIVAEDQRGRDSPSKPASSKESSSRGFSSLSPTNIPLPEKPLSKSFEPFTLGRGSKLTRQPLKKPGSSSTREAGRSGASANFNFQDFEVLDECGDA